MLKVNKLDHCFGGLRAIANFNLTVHENGIYGVIGPNGAGKTTLFNLISGIFKPTQGEIIFDGKKISGCKPHEIAKLGVARTFQNLRLFNDLTVTENVRVGILNRHSNKTWRDTILDYTASDRRQDDIIQRLLDLVGISVRSADKAGSLPYGMQRKLEIARALATQPKLLLLDEPAAGMNPKEVMGLVDLIRSAKREFNLTIILIEHQLRLVEALCEEVTVMNFGQVIARGTLAEVQNDKTVIKAYLGEGEVG